MKSNVKLKIIVLITLSILFTFSPIFSSNLNFYTRNNKISSRCSYDFNLDNENPKISAVSGKIHINGNSEWVAFKNDGNCSGEGIYSNPYIIEDLVIDGGGSGSCIWIENSDVYFKIENCTVYNTGGSSNAGIKLSNCNNSQLINNICSSNCEGIFLNSSQNNIISGNTANDNDGNGIRLYYCNSNNISGNTANDNDGNGILLFHSDFNMVSGNIGNYNFQGIELYESNNNIFSGNTANNNTDDGISIIGISNNNKVSSNTADNNNDDGIYLASSNNNTISGNTVNNNSCGIKLSYSDYNNVSGNILIGNDECIVEDYCQGNKFSNNGDCDYSEDGGGIPIEMIILISSVSGGAVIGVVAILLIIRKRKRI